MKPKHHDDWFEFIEDVIIHLLAIQPVDEWFGDSFNVEPAGPWSPLILREIGPLPPTAVARIVAEALRICGERREISMKVALWASGLLPVSLTPRDRAQDIAAQKKAAEYVARNPEAGLRALSRATGIPRSTLQTFNGQPRFRRFVDEAKARQYSEARRYSWEGEVHEQIFGASKKLRRRRIRKIGSFSV